MSTGEGFFSRWSQRKVQVRQGEAPPEPVHAAVPAPAPAQPPAPATAASVPAPAEPALPPPTLDEVARLPEGAEVARFVARGVDPSVKNAALKKLFADPHFNVMDGLDIYIDDYGRPDPLPAAMLRQMAQSRFLGLFEEDRPATAPESLADATPGALPDENPDLRLQPNDAAGHGGDRPRAGDDPGRPLRGPGDDAQPAVPA
ncbi:hypothetical protein ABIC99_002994 [Sphaerotilus sulfidivorans]|uniref:DUF3306 domain-containing protein n=1 Tax=Sphaerotilus sulfidivorans TaxID=639200 RepID=A0A5C1Q356_9BURK|nr:DUF3306 domain-containing protein [Sphaerotilus sulfidivorans]QEN01878.1 DUF3306 domain-containing protein [Sphaerotilus sulfidivorans]